MEGMMFDDYPDKFMMRRICRRIEEQLEEKGKSGGSSGGEELEELIGVLLCERCTGAGAAGEIAAHFFKFPVADFT